MPDHDVPEGFLVDLLGVRLASYVNAVQHAIERQWRNLADILAVLLIPLW